MKKGKLIIGIDEAGRGPLAGPIAIGAIAIGPLNAKVKNQNVKFLKGIKDSKKLSAQQREFWYKIIKKNFECHCVFVSHKTIDKLNVYKATLLGVEKVLKKFKKKLGLILLDGSLYAPKEYKQKTIIKGDEKIPLISAASIIAKVCRDRRMIRLHKKFPHYGFDRHKGYGTKLHYKKIKKYGPCKIHRKSYNISIW
ncbi:MAG: ribonuclease HII [Candidatus Terrybacteria bacterium]|nr:ribonuclease HII [Candidatus Terrybacteria bacterium]